MAGLRFSLILLHGHTENVLQTAPCWSGLIFASPTLGRLPGQRQGPNVGWAELRPTLTLWGHLRPGLYQAWVSEATSASRTGAALSDSG